MNKIDNNAELWLHQTQRIIKIYSSKQATKENLLWLDKCLLIVKRNDIYWLGNDSPYSIYYQIKKRPCA